MNHCYKIKKSRNYKICQFICIANIFQEKSCVSIAYHSPPPPSPSPEKKNNDINKFFEELLATFPLTEI